MAESTTKKVAEKDKVSEKVKTKNVVTLDSIADAAENGDKDVVKCEWRGVKFNLKPNLNVGEVVFFCSDIIESVFGDGADNYRPELIEIAILNETIVSYTDLELPEETEKLSYILCCTDLVDFIKSKINSEQYNMMVNSVRERARYIVDSAARAVEQKVDEVYTVMKDFIDKFAGIFEGVSEVDLENLLGAVSSGSIDEDKLVKAYIENTTRE